MGQPIILVYVTSLPAGRCGHLGTCQPGWQSCMSHCHSGVKSIFYLNDLYSFIHTRLAPFQPAYIQPIFTQSAGALLGTALQGHCWGQLYWGTVEDSTTGALLGTAGEHCGGTTLLGYS